MWFPGPQLPLPNSGWTGRFSLVSVTLQGKRGLQSSVAQNRWEAALQTKNLPDPSLLPEALVE